MHGPLNVKKKRRIILRWIFRKLDVDGIELAQDRDR
jgi:hypothetical protein